MTYTQRLALQSHLAGWTSEKLKFLKDNDCFEMRVEDSGLMERLATLIESVENR